MIEREITLHITAKYADLRNTFFYYMIFKDNYEIGTFHRSGLLTTGLQYFLCLSKRAVSYKS